MTLATPNAAFSTTSADFTQPASGATVIVSVLDGTMYNPGELVQAGSGGVYAVTEIVVNALHLVNLTGYPTNASPGYIVPTGTIIYPVGTALPAGIVAAPVVIDLPTNGAPLDTTITVPNRALLGIPIARVSLALVGAGTCVIDIGTTPGGGEILAPFTIDNTTPQDTGIGVQLAEAGPSLNPGAGYVLDLPTGTTLTVRLTPTPPVTGGQVVVSIMGDSYS